MNFALLRWRKSVNKTDWSCSGLFQTLSVPVFLWRFTLRYLLSLSCQFLSSYCQWVIAILRDDCFDAVKRQMFCHKIHEHSLLLSSIQKLEVFISRLTMASRHASEDKDTTLSVKLIWFQLFLPSTIRNVLRTSVGKGQRSLWCGGHKNIFIALQNEQIVLPVFAQGSIKCWWPDQDRRIQGDTSIYCNSWLRLSFWLIHHAARKMT